MCFDCQRRWREDLTEAKAAANEHMDSLGVPADSLVRGIAEVQMACASNPMLNMLMSEMYPTPEQLTS